MGLRMTDKTTGGAVSQLKNSAKSAGLIDVYSHVTRLLKHRNRAVAYMLKMFAALGLGLTLSFPATAALYKWVDDNGTTHYGQTIPPEYADKDHEVLNKSGRVIETQEVMTPERRRAKQLQDEKNRRQAEVELEQQRHDRTLLATYSNVNEIDLASARNLQQIDARINAINAYIKSASSNLDALQAEIDHYNKAKQKIPYSLKQDLKITQERLAQLHQDLQGPQADKATMQARFAADRQRYIQLTGIKQGN